MVLPGRVPGYKSSDIQLLPSSTTKHQVWELYQQAASVEYMHPVSSLPVMAVLFFWHIQQRSLIGFITTT